MSQDPFDIPLFREIQKILASGEGPLNMEIARQVATAVTQDLGGSSGDLDAARELQEAVHSAELLVS
ncbi:MAG: hypothetical protein ACRDKT_17910, partial [Actinomycetota bacterium]